MILNPLQAQLRQIADNIKTLAKRITRLEVRSTQLSSSFMVTITGLINVMDFGAVGDGITDDTAAVQSAINFAEITGGTVLFPHGVSGSYLITSSLTITASAVSLIAFERDIFLVGSASLGANPILLVNAGGTTQISNLVLQNLYFMVNSNTGTGITLSKCVEPIMIGVTIKGNNTTEYGMKIDALDTWAGGLHAYAVRIVNVKFGIKFTNHSAAGSNFTGCWIVGTSPKITGSIAFEADATCGEVNIHGCDIEGWDTGVKTAGGGWGVIANRFEKVTTPGNQVSNAEWLTIMGNSYADCGAHVISYENRVMILDNVYGEFRFPGANPMIKIIANSTTLPAGMELYNTSDSGTAELKLYYYHGGLTDVFDETAGSNEMCMATPVGALKVGSAGAYALGLYYNKLKRMEMNGYGAEFPDRDYGPVLRSPDGSRWLLRVDNAGAASWTKL